MIKLSGMTLPALGPRPPRGYFQRPNRGRLTLNDMRRITVLARPFHNRARRMQFLASLAAQWINPTYFTQASLANLAAAISPWTNWSNEVQTLNPFEAWMIFFSAYYPNIRTGTTDVSINPFAPNAFPNTWRSPAGWSNARFDNPATPFSIQIDYVGVLSFRAVFQATIYLAKPGQILTPGIANPPLYYVFNRLGVGDITNTFATFNLPAVPENYPFELPTRPTTIVIRPNSGLDFNIPPVGLFKSAPTDQLFYLVHPGF